MEENIEVLKKELERKEKIFEEKYVLNMKENDYLSEEAEQMRKEIRQLRSKIKEIKEKDKNYNTAYNLGKAFANKQWESKIKEKIEELRKYRDLAREDIEERVIIADSDSLNYGRAEAHDKDIQVLQELLEDK